MCSFWCKIYAKLSHNAHFHELLEDPLLCIDFRKFYTKKECILNCIFMSFLVSFLIDSYLFEVQGERPHISQFTNQIPTQVTAGPG